MPNTPERYVLRCTHTIESIGPYEMDFKTRKDAEARRDAIAARTDDGTCNEPHLIIRQVWVDGKWVDTPEEADKPTHLGAHLLKTVEEGGSVTITGGEAGGNA